MGFLLILVLGGLYLALALWVTVRMKTVARKLTALLVFSLIPTADAVYGRIKLKHLCATEGGLRIYSVVQDVEGFYVDGSAGRYWLAKYGYLFVEGDSLGGSHVRISRIPSGEVIEEEKVVLKSRFAARFVPGNVKDIYKVDRFQAVSLATNEMLGESTNFLYAGGWVERFVGGFYGTRGQAGNCGLDYPERQQEQLVTAVLKPIARLTN